MKKGEEPTLFSILEDAPDAEQQAIEREWRELVAGCVEGCLNDREKRLLRAYYGLDGGEGCTLEAIGNDLGVTRERARQIRDQALKKLRRFFRQRMPGVTCDDVL